MKKAQDYLPAKRLDDDVLVQARIPKALFREVRKFMDENMITWSDMAIASFRKFLDDMKKEK